MKHNITTLQNNDYFVFQLNEPMTRDAGIEIAIEANRSTEEKNILSYLLDLRNSRHIETLMTNAGYQVRLFRDEESAISWLTEK